MISAARLPATEMRMNTDVFRSQMQALKASGVPVISMKEIPGMETGGHARLSGQMRHDHHR